MTDELPTPLWRLKGDGYSDVVIVNGTVYPVGAPRRSWELPANLRDHEPVNWTAKFIARYNARLFHHPLRPRSASTKHGIFLPSVLIFGGSCTGYLGEGGVPDDAPRYKYSGTLLTWPGSYQTKYDGPENKSAELVLNWRNCRPTRARCRAANMCRSTGDSTRRWCPPARRSRRSERGHSVRRRP
jgi:hypothetical protein